MQNIKNIFGILFLLGLFTLLVRCGEEPTESIFDPNAPKGVTPVITDVQPPNSALAGIGKVTITGQNFSPNKDYNFVFFGSTKVSVLTASATQLVVKSPNVVLDTLFIKVAVHKVELFSNSWQYKLAQAVWEYGGVLGADEPYALDCDKDENLYVVLLPIGVTKTITKITPDEVKTTYATTTLPVVSSMKIGWGGLPYLARATKDIYYVPAGGNAATKWKSAPGRVADFDFSQKGILYGGGKDGAIYSMDQAGNTDTVAVYATNTNIKAVRVYNGYLYVGGIDNTNAQYVWRHLINADNTLGSSEVYFNWSEKISSIPNEIQSITFAEDGDMYLGTNAPEAIIVVHPDGSHEALYPGVLEPEGYGMSWGKGNYLYVCRRNSSDQAKQRIIKINMLKSGAPYYGRTL